MAELSGKTAAITGAAERLGRLDVSQPQRVSIDEVLIRPTGQAR